MPFHDAPISPPKSFTFFSIWYIIWSYPTSTEFSVHLLLIKVKYSVLSELFNYLFISSYFRTFCKHPSLQFLNHSFQPFYFHSVFSLNSLNLRFFFNPSSPLDFLYRKLTSSLSLFISPLILHFHLGSFFFLCSAFFNPLVPDVH